MTVPHDDNKWRKSTRSQGGDSACIELHPAGSVRDSKNASGPQLAVEFAGLVAAVKAGRITL